MENLHPSPEWAISAGSESARKYRKDWTAAHGRNFAGVRGKPVFPACGAWRLSVRRQKEDVGMSLVVSSKSEGVATVRIERGKVNALNGTVVLELHDVFRGLETDVSVRSVILTGTGSFFLSGSIFPNS